MRLILILIWIVVTGVIFLRSRRMARLDPMSPRGIAAWRPMTKSLFHAALIGGLIVFVGGSVMLAQLTGQFTINR